MHTSEVSEGEERYGRFSFGSEESVEGHKSRRQECEGVGNAQKNQRAED